MPHAFNMIAGTEKFWSTILHISASWTITCLVATCAYIAGRRLLSR